MKSYFILQMKTMTQERKLSDLPEHECLDQNPGLLILIL